MKAQALQEKNIEMLQAQLLELLREQFNLRTKIASGQLKQTHLMKQPRRDIARIKTILAHKKGV